MEKTLRTRPEDSEALLALLQRDPGAALLPGERGRPPLHSALECFCTPAMLALLLRFGADAGQLDARGATVLEKALALPSAPTRFSAQGLEPPRCVGLGIVLLNHGAVLPLSGAKVHASNDAGLRYLRAHSDAVLADVIRRAFHGEPHGPLIANFLHGRQ